MCHQPVPKWAGIHLRYHGRRLSLVGEVHQLLDRLYNEGGDVLDIGSDTSPGFQRLPLSARRESSHERAEDILCGLQCTLPHAMELYFLPSS